GVTGELYIGGDGVGRGYLNDARKTAEFYLPAPFPMEAGARVYRSGDLARYLLDSNLEYLGRIDHQVKIRGFRIELGEIEATLREHGTVEQAVIDVREDKPGEKRLVAYVVKTDLQGSGYETERVTQWREFLSERLPEDMVPAVFVEMERLPLTPNGKLDRRGLPAPDRADMELDQVYVPPRTPVEEIVVGIFEEVLSLDRVGVHDNFFEIGGHSLLATQVISRARNTFEVEINVRSLFEAVTAARLAEVVIAQEPPPGQTEKIAMTLKKLSNMTDEDADAELAALEQ